MGRAGVAHECGLAAGLLQRDEELLPLADRAALVGFAVHDQGRRGGVVGELGGGVGGVGICAARTGAPPNWLLAPTEADIAGAAERLEVEDRRATDAGVEALGLADDPTGHVAAVGVAVDAHALGIDVGALDQHVDDGHQVFVSPRRPSPRSPVRRSRGHSWRSHAGWRRRPGSRGSPAPAAAGGRCSRRTLRATVDIQHQRVLLARVEIRRGQQPALDREARTLRSRSAPSWPAATSASASAFSEVMTLVVPALQVVDGHFANGIEAASWSAPRSGGQRPC